MGVGDTTQLVEDSEGHAAKAQNLGFYNSPCLKDGNNIPLRLKAKLLRHKENQLVPEVLINPAFNLFKAESGFPASSPTIDQSKTHS